MRRIVGIVFVFVLHAGLLVSGTHVAYSEAVPAEIMVAREAAKQQLVQPWQSIPESHSITAIATAPAPRQAAPVIRGNTLTVPSIGLAAPIVNVGVTATNNIDVPAGLQVGRWTGSAVPGAPGAVFLDGHVDGVFARLSRVAVGQTLSVSYAGQQFAYRVVHKEVVPLAGIDMNRALSTYGGAPEGLNIMTCAGSYVPATGTYDRRLIVYTVRA